MRTNLPIHKVLLLQDNAQPHISIKTKKTITSFRWTALLYLPYSPDLAPSDDHIFAPMKEGLRGKHYAHDEEVKTAVMKNNQQNFIWQGYKLSFKGGTLKEVGMWYTKTNFILMYDTCSCVGNNSCSKEKGITYFFTKPHIKNIYTFLQGCMYYYAKFKLLQYYDHMRDNYAAAGASAKIMKVRNYTLRCQAYHILSVYYSLDLPSWLST